MPILDLIASITGEKPSASSTPASRPSTALPKRKAEDDIRPAGTKVARVDSLSEKSSRPSGNSPRPSPRPADRPLGGSSDKAISKPQPALDKRSLTDKPNVHQVRAGSAGTRPSNGSKPLPSRPAPNRPSPTDSGPPKKRSYAEIMARAKANSEHRESLGKIQHKTVERNMTMKERKEMKVEDARKSKTGTRKPTTARSGPTSASFRDVAKSPGARGGLSGSANPKKTAPAEEKKVKKAALATTGYTGTARPRPGSSTVTKSGAASRPSSEGRPRDRPRYGGPVSSSRSRREEEDEMDDFIVDDEDEDEAPGYNTARQYRYDSYEEESDMEAGISDIEDEEQLADRQARREDLEQEALEKRLKREKEERRRRFLEATKSKAGR
ncbi:hypothetical protein CHGG_05863 [Chaetomium globosum CBS 148.51]|uniref:SPT2 chromatin protein n=1 Tax=Chaetomium globosum (strain ATCC 6205 / CBS 148.51 / DSM 1962 / NBRC 6347 / NRRL 1970) TaxID=306901 RepID=Q2H652_CHAGB|nr:uncharacterized protein CHGG_05863 [Chaetomium globosum CBS 148.51]EAQ89244.1 hypothetical protein CHGG_05863 [Chaetomium globosum CBS 148.51]